VGPGVRLSRLGLGRRPEVAHPLSVAHWSVARPWVVAANDMTALEARPAELVSSSARGAVVIYTAGTSVGDEVPGTIALGCA